MNEFLNFYLLCTAGFFFGFLVGNNSQASDRSEGEYIYSVLDIVLLILISIFWPLFSLSGIVSVFVGPKKP